MVLAKLVADCAKFVCSGKKIPRIDTAFEFTESARNRNGAYAGSGIVEPKCSMNSQAIAPVHPEMQDEREAA
jgi:hypothetical protein